MTYLAIPGVRAQRIASELLVAAPLESGTFCELRTVRRGDLERYVLGEPIESTEPWVAQANQRLTPNGRRISAAVSVACQAQCGLAFVHSHPMTAAVPSLSRIDRETTDRLGATLTKLVDGPFASLVVSSGGWGGALATAHGLVPLSRIAVVGTSLDLYGKATSQDDVLDDRQVRALGSATQRRLRSLRVAIIGAGGLGSPIAETLARMGVAEIRLIDHDRLDTPSNARRIFGIRRADLQGSPPKAEAVAAGLQRLDLGTEVIPVVGDVREAQVQEQLLDVDVIVNGTDTHSSRASVSELSMRAAVPLIDVGVRVGLRRSGRLDALRLERRIQVPGGPCLWCWGTLDAEQVRIELLPEDQREGLEQEGYIAGRPGDPAPSLAALTVTGAGTATSALLGMLTGALEAAPLGVGLDALSLESVPFSRQEPDPACVCSRWR
jgi:hypothetical protein